MQTKLDKANEDYEIAKQPELFETAEENRVAHMGLIEEASIKMRAAKAHKAESLELVKR